MAEFRGETFDDEVLDGNVYNVCTFKGKLIYNGGGVPELNDCKYERARFTMELQGPSVRTLQFLQKLYHSGPEGKQMVEAHLQHGIYRPFNSGEG